MNTDVKVKYDKKFVNLRVVSHYSKLQSILTIPKLIDKIVEMGHPTVALCDSNLFGAVKFSQQAIKRGIKPIIAVQISVEELGIIPVFIKSTKGYLSVSSLISNLAIAAEEKATFNDLLKLEDVVILTGTQSIFYQPNQYNQEALLLRLKDHFKDDLFVEIDYYGQYEKVVSMAHKLDIPMVLTANAVMANAKDKKYFYALKVIDNNGYYDRVEQNNYPEHCLLNYPNFPIKEAIANTVVIAEKCSFVLEAKNPIIPVICSNEPEELRKQVENKLEQYLLKNPTYDKQIYYQRLEYELSILIEKNFCGYFLVTADFINYAIENNIPVGLGRGSGAGSLVAYMLGITGVDPIKFKLLFERFLNPQRSAMPDFDIDFCPEGRPSVINYLRTKYGKYNIANIITFGSFHARGIIQSVCKIFRIPFFQALKISKLVPFNAVKPVTLSEALEMMPQLKKYQQEYPDVFDIAFNLEGIIKNIGKHAAGVIISNKPIYLQCPLHREKDSELVTQFDFRDMETVGGVKFDFLGLITLTILKEIYTKKNINLSSIPLNDPKTFQLFNSLNLEGVFQFESGGMRNIIGKLQPNHINDLIAINALFRPGPVKHVPDYIKNKQNPHAITYLHPTLEPILKDTFGVLVYQEQVMEIAQVLGGYSLAEADILRRVMGKKKFTEMESQKIKFINGAIVNKVPEQIANEIFNKMASFSGYGFNKSHSTPYAIIGYYCAYFKTHYNLDFIAACISKEIHNKEKVGRYISELIRTGYTIITPDINNSSVDYVIENNKLFLGLNIVKNTNQKLLENIISERNKKPYCSVIDFIQRNLSHINKKNWITLVYSGALDSFKCQQEDLINNFESLRRAERIITGNQVKNLYGEYLGIGFFINNHPTRLCKLQNFNNTKQLYHSKQNKDSVWVMGSVLKYTMKSNRSKRSYGVIELQDHTGLIDIVCFGEMAENKLIKTGIILAIQIQLHVDIVNKVIAHKIMLLDEYLEQYSNQIILYPKTRKQVKLLKQILQDNPGNTSVVLHIQEKNTKSKFKIKDSLILRQKLHSISVLNSSKTGIQ